MKPVLVLSSSTIGITCRVTLGMHDLDHKVVLAEVVLSVPASESVRRRVYDYKKADWIQLCKLLSSTDWDTFFEELSADDAV